MKMLLLSGLIAASSSVQAKDYPTKPVSIVTGYATGGPIDVLARGLAQKLSDNWNGKPVIVENKPGANEILAASSVARAQPDGHTILLGTDPSLSHNLFLFKKLPYDPINDLIPISRIAQVNMMLVVRGDLPVDNLAQFIALMKKEKGKHNYGSSSSGSTTHLGFEQLQRETGIQLTQVPYKGIAPALLGMLGGDISAMVAAYSAVAPQIKEGRVKVLAVAGRKRSPALPDVPTFAEAGYPDVTPGFYVGISTSKGTPDETVQKIAIAFERLLDDKAFVRSYKDRYDYDLFSESPKSFSEFLLNDRKQAERNIKDAGVILN